MAPNPKVARAKALGGLSAPSTSSSSSPSSSSTARNGRGGGGGGDRGGGNIRCNKVAFAVGLLDIAIPRDDRPGGSFPRVMVNDACIARAVQGEAGSLCIFARTTCIRSYCIIPVCLVARWRICNFFVVVFVDLIT